MPMGASGAIDVGARDGAGDGVGCPAAACHSASTTTSDLHTCSIRNMGARHGEKSWESAPRFPQNGSVAAPYALGFSRRGPERSLVSTFFSLADLNVVAVSSRAVDMDWSASPNLKAWLARCLDRPAARAALALKSKADSETPAEITRRIARTNRL